LFGNSTSVSRNHAAFRAACLVNNLVIFLVTGEIQSSGCSTMPSGIGTTGRRRDKDINCFDAWGHGSVGFSTMHLSFALAWESTGLLSSLPFSFGLINCFFIACAGHVALFWAQKNPAMSALSERKRNRQQDFWRRRLTQRRLKVRAHGINWWRRNEERENNEG
jgi:hypothetical protein